MSSQPSTWSEGSAPLTLKRYAPGREKTIAHYALPANSSLSPSFRAIRWAHPASRSPSSVRETLGRVPKPAGATVSHTDRGSNVTIDEPSDETQTPGISRLGIASC